MDIQFASMEESTRYEWMNLYHQGEPVPPG